MNFSISDKGIFIKEAVEKNDTSKKTVNIIQSFLTEEEKFPVTRIPVSKIALAGLSVLGVSKYKGNDEQVLYYIEVFKHMKD